MEKYKLTDETIIYNGHTLYRIQALHGFSGVKAGELGGWVESEFNLSQNGTCWISDEAKVYDNAIVFGDAKLYDNAEMKDRSICMDSVKLYDDVKLYDNVFIYDNAELHNNVRLYNNVHVHDNVILYDDVNVYNDVVLYNDIIIRGNAVIYNESDYIYFYKLLDKIIWTKSNNKFAVDNFYGTPYKFIKYGFSKSLSTGIKYIKFVNNINKLKK